MSDTTDTSIYDSPPVSRRHGRKGSEVSQRQRRSEENRRSEESQKSEESRPKSIKRSLLLKALRTLENDLKDTFPDVDPLQEKFRQKATLEAFRRCCSLDLTTQPASSWSCTSSSKIRQLVYALTNSVFRHDWGTAARCIHMMLDLERCAPIVYRALLLVLFNHPHSSTETVETFMRRALNLRTKSEQLTFLRQMFLLPDDIVAYTRQQDRMSTKIQDEDMTTSEDNE